MRMMDNGRGGMQSAGLNYLLWCPRCGRPAFRRDDLGDEWGYHHFTKKGSVIHRVKKDK